MKVEELLALPKTRELINLPEYGLTIWSNSYPYGYPNSRLRINATKQLDYYVRLDDGEVELLPTGNIWELTNIVDIRPILEGWGGCRKREGKQPIKGSDRLS